jgi:hypothetical protein
MIRAGYHALQSVDPRFRSGVELIGILTSEASLTLADGVNTISDPTFFQVRAVSSDHQEGP